MAYDQNNIFAKIVRGEAPVQMVHEHGCVQFSAIGARSVSGCTSP